MNDFSVKTLLLLLVRRLLGLFVCLVPEGRLKYRIRAAVAKTMQRIPSDLLVNPGDTVLLIGFHNIDRVRHWSFLVGPTGHIIVIQAVPAYIENLRVNLEHYMHWKFNNIRYIQKGVHSEKGKARIQIGQHAGYNKLADHGVVDGLTEDDFVEEIEIETDTVDSILQSNRIEKINHIHMSISGLEVEALKGMGVTLETKGIRIGIKSLHSMEDEPLFKEVLNILKRAGLNTVMARKSKKGRAGRDIYGCRLS